MGRVSSAPYGGRRLRRARKAAPRTKLQFMVRISDNCGYSEDVGLGCERKETPGMRWTTDVNEIIFSPESKVCKKCLAYVETCG